MQNETLGVVIFAYNRPANFSKLLDSIIESENSKEFEYFIYIDGPKANENLEVIREVCKLADSFKDKVGESKVSIISRSANIGLAQSVIQGVTEVFKNKSKAIILEDDLILSKKSLIYFSRALDIYVNEPKVGAICGYVPFELHSQESTFFLNEASSWGWATWSDRWKEANWNSKYLYEEIINSNKVYEFDSLGTYPFTEMLSLQNNQKIDSWAIRWQANLFLDNKLCLYPKESLINNLGFRGVGTHGTKDRRYEVKVCQDFDVNIQPIVIEENSEARAALSNFYFRLNSNSGTRSRIIKLLVKVKRMLNNLLNLIFRQEC